MKAHLFPLSKAGTDDQDDALPEGAPKIGALLVEAGRLSPEGVDSILDFQKSAGLPFGESGIAMGLLSEQDVQQALAKQFGHAALSPDAGYGNELIAALQPESPAAEHLRALRSQLMLRWFESDPRHVTLAVVSPGVGEGRSYITANLAVLFAQLGKRTLLIDANMRRPRQQQIFGLTGRVGLSAMLANRAGAEAVNEIKSLPGLSVLTAGAMPPNPQELLARDGFARVLTAFKSSYDVILIDTPAASSCADAGMIAARSGAALMLACRDRSSVPRVSRLAEDLRQVGVTVVGAVLNGASRP